MFVEECEVFFLIEWDVVVGELDVFGVEVVGYVCFDYWFEFKG